MDERVAIVTGGGAGLGRELSLGLARAGFAVVVVDIDEAAAQETAREATRLHASAIGVRADVREAGQVREVVRVATARGRLKVLVNNAGGWTSGDRQFPEAAHEDWAATLALNLTAPMLLTQLALGPMREAGGGAVVTVASSAARGDQAYGSPEYAASKAALIRLTTSLRGLDASHGVRVMCVVPGWIGLDRAHAELAAMAPADRAATAPLIPPGDVVSTVLDLITTGQSGAVVDM